ncbi:hypothetical protein HMPREF1486_03149 [Streptomyces sp. HPH0547]|uniref:helix-turn-helix domain-containing protein n=1 Tax=Streptomyces sp. HPH0547 TaxID=1203592 RepID=UPI00034E4CE2|nr:helix-turn-helix transcriptional regulator [Streptomyces sp. HPH0547]EPD94596.1 hypothetical protein HMPREF1486_03149 [Streptomyces sp. HPH0547]
MLHVFGEQVKQGRRAKGWTQAQLARSLGDTIGHVVNPLTITRIEAGTRPTPINEAVALAQLLDISLDSLASNGPRTIRASAYLIRYPKGQGDDILVEDASLTLDVAHGWAVLADQHGPCIAVPAHSGVTITRIDQDQQPEE